METLTTCPRGHALAEGAVYCTVCWIRVSPEDRAAVPAHRRRRRMILAIPLIGAGSIAVGVIVGALIASAPDDVAQPVAASQASVAASTAVDVPADQPVAVVAAPLAATVPKPVEQPVEEPVATGCVATVRDTDVPCTLADGRLEFTLCVPWATSVIRVGTRPDDTVKFEDAPSSVVLGGPSSCAADEIVAIVGINAYSPAVTWRVVGRDAADDKIWKSRVVTAAR